MVEKYLFRTKKMDEFSKHKITSMFTKCHFSSILRLKKFDYLNIKLRI